MSAVWMGQVGVDIYANKENKPLFTIGNNSLIKETKKERKKKRYSKEQWFTLFVIGSFHFSSALCISLQAPFYPQEAELKGATATEYGLVFGSFEFVAFITSPIIGKYLYSMGVKRSLNFGIFLAAISAILFGLLDLVPGHIPFIGLSFFLRMTEALGSTLALVAVFSITAAAFPDTVATTFATLEVFYGLGYIIGPTLGGILFAAGGYILPFACLGAFMIIVGFFTMFALPGYKMDTSSKSTTTMWDILRIPSILLDSLCIIGTSISMGFLASTLEPHIRDFGLAPVSNALMFVISGGVYAVCAPFVGRLCDKYIYPKKVIACGCIFFVTSYCLVGPLPYLPIPKTLTVCIIGLIIHGFGVACMMAPTFIDSIRAAVDRGYPDDLSTHGLVSGLWSSSFAFGAFVGPSIAGVLFDHVGFSYATIFPIAVHAFLFILMSTFICKEKRVKFPLQRIRIISGCESATSDEENKKNPYVDKSSYGSIANNITISSTKQAVMVL